MHNGVDGTVHRFVMEILLGHPIPPHHHVHHIDNDHNNNHPDNLQLLPGHAHMALSSRKRPLVDYCRRCGLPFLSEVSGPVRKRFCSWTCATSHRHRPRPRPRRPLYAALRRPRAPGAPTTIPAYRLHRAAATIKRRAAKARRAAALAL